MYLVKIDASGFVTDLDYPEEHNVVKIFPNPFFDFVQIKFDKTLNADYTLYLFDALGREVSVKSGYFQNEILVERNNLPAGTYFFNIISGKKSIGRGKLIALE